MAITGDLYKGFTFGDVSSKAYDVYITQEAAYNSPERDLERIEIAGRNGAYILDNGRFLNIEVSYRCGLVRYSRAGGEFSEQQFRSAINVFRNALASQIGYVRLEDDYNPLEFRQAAFLGGIEVTMADRRAGEFTITFDCKPQRFLKSGETRKGLARVDAITNPTLFPSSPLFDFSATGDGSFTIGDYTVSVVDALVGKTPLKFSEASPSPSSGYAYVHTLTIDNESVYNAGDSFTLDGFTATYSFTMRLAVSGASFSNNNGLYTSVSVQSYRVAARVTSETASFVAGTASTVTQSATLQVSYREAGTESVTITVTLAYDGDKTITIRANAPDFASGSELAFSGKPVYTGEVDSTASNIESTIYLDCELGEAYSIIDGNVVSMNNYVSFGADLPVINPGSNATTRDSTIVGLGVVPRWWEV